MCIRKGRIISDPALSEEWKVHLGSQPKLLGVKALDEEPVFGLVTPVVSG